jgi:prolipoprotein diacylglyceryltransferase
LKIQKTSKETFFRLLDHIVTIVPLGIMLWRIGNFLNRELYGVLATNKAILSSIQNSNRFTYTRETLLVRPDIYAWMEKVWLIFDYGTSIQRLGEMRINTNILASFFEGFILLVIMQLLYWLMYRKWKKKAWRLSWIFLLRYSSIRFLLEFLRQDSQYELVAWLSYSQRWFVWFFILGSYLLVRKTKAN